MNVDCPFQAFLGRRSCWKFNECGSTGKDSLENKWENTRKINSFSFPRSWFHSFCSVLQSLFLCPITHSKLNWLPISTRKKNQKVTIPPLPPSLHQIIKIIASGPIYHACPPTSVDKWPVVLSVINPSVPIEGHGLLKNCPFSHTCQ